MVTARCIKLFNVSLTNPSIARPFKRFYPHSQPNIAIERVLRFTLKLNLGASGQDIDGLEVNAWLLTHIQIVSGYMPDLCAGFYP